MKFGVREICDVVFKAAAEGQRVGYKSFKKYQPCFKIDTATTSEMTQESTTVYAQGGKGYNRLIAWEGEKTMTFTVTDALMSPMGLAVLTGAGLIRGAAEDADGKAIHVHVTYKVAINEDGDGEIDFRELVDELGLDYNKTTSIDICNDVDIYGTVLDDSGSGVAWIDTIKLTSDLGEEEESDRMTLTKEAKVMKVHIDDEDAFGKTVELDFYVVMTQGVTEITIEPGDFGGYFYVEADTLFRREDNGKDMAATLTFPRVKIQSGFTFTMAASGDPSTFDFVMDAMPGYTLFDRTKKVCVAMTIVGSDDLKAVDEDPHANVIAHDHLKDEVTPGISEEAAKAEDVWVKPIA